MKTLGLIGGTGPESTIEYYRLLTAQYRAKADGASPLLIINSVNLKQMIEWMGANELGKVTEYLVNAFAQLERAGADFGALTANTPHIVFDELKQRCSLPLVSIVEATCERVQALRLKTHQKDQARINFSKACFEGLYQRQTDQTDLDAVDLYPGLYPGNPFLWMIVDDFGGTLHGGAKNITLSLFRATTVVGELT